MAFSKPSASGLGTILTVNIPTSDIYNFMGTLTATTQVSAATAGPGGGAGTGTGGADVQSQVVVTVKQNGTTIFTSAAGDLGFGLSAVVCAASDVITFTTSSSLAQDQQPNAIRLTLAVSEGPI